MGYKVFSIFTYTLLVILLVPALILYIFIRLFAPYKHQINYVYKVNRLVMNIWTPMAGMRLSSQFNPSIDVNETYIVVMNHVNIIDMFIAAKCLKVPAKPLIKKEILSVPILGWMFSMTAIAVKREKKESRNNAYKAMKNELDKGISLLVFPEGSRNNSIDPLHEFKAGAFNLAIESNIKILPVVVLHSRKMVKGKSMLYRPGKAILHYLNPIDPQRFNEASTLSKYCYDKMLGKILALDDNFKNN